MALTIAFTACSESNDEEEEFTEWQSTNDSYFDNLYAQTKAKIAAGDASWKIIKTVATWQCTATTTSSCAS